MLWPVALLKFLLACLGGLMVPSTAWSSPEASLEYKVKAAFLYNFAKFVEWPPERLPQPDSPIVIGVVGEDPFGSILDETVRGKAVHGHPIVVQRLNPTDDLTPCHILFISRSLKDSVDTLLGGLGSDPILTVSEIEKFALRGGIINFIIVNESVKFEICLETAERARLKVSARLSSVARVVRRESPNPN